MSEKLKPCPFCGGDDVNTEGRTEKLQKQMFCWTCGASGPHPAYDEASWNHRPLEQELVEALRETPGLGFSFHELEKRFDTATVDRILRIERLIKKAEGKS